MRRLRAEVNSDGTVGLEFVGFQGEECSEERDRLRGALEALGVLLEPGKMRKKSAQEMASEVLPSERGPTTKLGSTG